jgi:hypothetical protein
MGTLYHVHAEEAARLCRVGSTVPMDAKEKVIAGILIVAAPGEQYKKKGTPNFSTRNYQGQSYVYLERLGEKDAFAGLTCYTFQD